MYSVVHIFSSMNSNGNVKYFSASMSLLNSPTKSGCVNTIFVFDARTLSFLTVDYQAFCVVKSILQFEISRFEH